MAVLAGRNGDIYLATGAGTSMTGEATTSLGGGVHQITLAGRRYISPNSALTVLDGATTVSPAKYQVAYGSGKIYLRDYTPVGTITVTGSFLTLSQVAQGTEWSLDITAVFDETQTFGDAWKERTVVQKEATCTFGRFYNDAYFYTNLQSYYVIELYADYAGGVRWQFGASQTSVGINVGENETIKENVSFSIVGVVDYLNT